MSYNDFFERIWSTVERGDVDILADELAYHHRYLRCINTLKGNMSLIHLASMNGHTTIIEYLIKLKCKALDTLEKYSGATPLLYAALYGHARVIETLYLLGSTSLNTPTLLGLTPLKAAFLHSHTKCIEILLQLGCAIDDHIEVSTRIYSYETRKVLTHLGFKLIIEPVVYDEEYAFKLRFRIYFKESLTTKLLRQNTHLTNRQFKRSSKRFLR